MHPALNQDRRHPELPIGPVDAVYVWQYPDPPVPLGHGAIDRGAGLHRILHP